MSGPRIRFVPSLTDEDRRQAVMSARAIVELDGRLADAVADVADRDARIVEQRESAQRGSEERRKLIDRMGAVRNLHAELEEVACADGCCHEGLGTCEYCEEPYPCATIRALDGEVER